MKVFLSKKIDIIVIIIPAYVTHVRIFFLREIFDLKIKNNDMGKNVKENALENIDSIYDTLDKYHFLKIKYIERR